MKNILVTGGAGYIGSHVVVELIKAGYHPVVLDNFSTSDKSSIPRIEKLVGQPLKVYEADYQNSAVLSSAINQETIDGIIHIAAYKAVGESVAQPLKYYQNNVAGFIALLETALAAGVNNFVFSSSAAVYGNPPTAAVTEEAPTKPENPYGWSKLMCDIVLRDCCRANPDIKGIDLRYFNVVGSHESAIIGESPKGKPQNLLPIIVEAVAANSPLTIFGNDYPTADGTCLRDYIHVVDLAKAHVAALTNARRQTSGDFKVYNLGTGKATSVLELIEAFERVNGVQVPYTIGKRRAGDPVEYYAVPAKANRELGWRAELTIDDAVRSAWQWQLAQSGTNKTANHR
jgi:UDP-glucose 4-epimerase